MKKKILSVIPIFLTSSLLFCCNIFAANYREASMNKIHYSINSEWKTDFGSGHTTYYDPLDGYDSDGNLCAFIITDYTYIASASYSEKDILDGYDSYETTFGNSENVNVIKSEDKEVAGLPARTIYATQKIGERDFNLQHTIFFYKGDLYSIGLAQDIEFQKDFTNEYEDILSSVEPEREYTKYTLDNCKVGTDIPAGEYVVFAEGDHGYFCVSPDSNQDDITFNDNFDYNSIITVNDGEYLELTHCYAIPIEEDPELDLTGDGMFKVGLHIPAGEYKLEATDDHGYYCIYPDSRQQDIVSNDLFEGQSYVTVSEGQYLILNGCKFSEAPQKPVKTYTDSDTVKKVQEALNAAGYDCGTPDGVAGSGTKAAIEKYQADKSLTVTGSIADELLKSLGI